jgi:molybdopterin converting factor subunit 1
MKIKIKFFAMHRDIVGATEIELEVNDGTELIGLLDLVIDKYPGLAKIRDTTLLSLNHNYAPDDYILNDGDEVAIFPPVGGG